MKRKHRLEHTETVKVRFTEQEMKVLIVRAQQRSLPLAVLLRLDVLAASAGT